MANGDESHPHLQLEREQPVTERRRPRGFAPPRAVHDPARHGANLAGRLEAARRAAEGDLGGSDDRRLIKIQLTDKVPPEDVARAMDGVEVVSQEEAELVLAFATDEQLDAFEARLATLARGGSPTYEKLLYALHDLDHWTPDDRRGWALERYGFPDGETFVLDAELWPLSSGGQASRQREAFEDWLREQQGRVIDRVLKPYLTIYRIECRRQLGEDLLRNRDVRTVDLLPSIALELHLPLTSVEDLKEVPPPANDSPGVAVLDSGLATGHPVLAPAVGEAASFVGGSGPNDDHGHGTFVSGIALYGDVEKCLRRRSFMPTLRLFSGRILDHQNSGDPQLVEKQVEEAVRYFAGEYGCRVFNLSYSSTCPMETRTNRTEGDTCRGSR